MLASRLNLSAPRQASFIEGIPAEKTSKLNLVDLGAKSLSYVAQIHFSGAHSNSLPHLDTNSRDLQLRIKSWCAGLQLHISLGVPASLQRGVSVQVRRGRKGFG